MLRKKDFINYKDVGGVYCIYNKLDGKRYIGSTNNLYKRLSDHWRKLINNKHENEHLQNAWNKHGKENFGFLIIEIITDLSYLRDIEQIYIDYLFCLDDRFGYNIRPKADFSEMSEDTKKKIGVANKKRYNIDEKLVIKLYKADVPAEEIYKICNISKPTLRKIRKKYNILEPRNRVYTVKAESHHLWKGGRPSCSECGKKLTHTRCKVCRDCYNKSLKLK